MVDKFYDTLDFLRSETELADFRVKRKMKAVAQTYTSRTASERKGSWYV